MSLPYLRVLRRSLPYPAMSPPYACRVPGAASQPHPSGVPATSLPSPHTEADPSPLHAHPVFGMPSTISPIRAPLRAPYSCPFLVPFLPHRFVLHCPHPVHRPVPAHSQPRPSPFPASYTALCAMMSLLCSTMSLILFISLCVLLSQRHPATALPCLCHVPPRPSHVTAVSRSHPSRVPAVPARNPFNLSGAACCSPTPSVASHSSHTASKNANDRGHFLDSSEDGSTIASILLLPLPSVPTVCLETTSTTTPSASCAKRHRK